MSAPIRPETIAERQALVARLMAQYGFSEKITSEDKFTSLLAKFYSVECFNNANKESCLDLFETEYDRNRPNPTCELHVGDIHIRLYCSCGALVYSSGTVFLKGESVDEALFSADILQRVVPQAQNERSFNSGKQTAWKS